MDAVHFTPRACGRDVTSWNAWHVQVRNRAGMRRELWLRMRKVLWLLVVVGCNSSPDNHGDTDPDASTDSGSDATMTPIDAPDDPVTVGGLGIVDQVTPLQSCNGAPQGSTCMRIRVSGCPGIETEEAFATIAVLMPSGSPTRTVVHFKGGGGQGYQLGGYAQYRTNGFRNVWVSWESDWEQTQDQGIKVAACRPATVQKWIFDDPRLHGGSKTSAFCGEGFSGGSAQVGYTLSHFGAGDYLDYVNELSGPPFARIDLGCNGDAPATTSVCGVDVTMRLPGDDHLNNWENIPAPLACGSTNVPAAELERWKNDSVAIGGVYAYPKTKVGFYECTHNPTAVAGESKYFYEQIEQAEGGTSMVGFNCYSGADGCGGEGLGTGSDVATQSMIDNCVPRHQ
jgi:hypothetical protein